MARRDLADAPLGRASLLPGLTAWEDMAGVNGAWQTVMDRTKVQKHLDQGGRIHLAVDDRWLIAYPAQVTAEPPC